MKQLRMLLLLALLAMQIVGCGSATEVGNPTGEVPLRTLSGTIDLSTIPLSILSAVSLPTTLKAIDPTELTVVATASITDFVEAPVDAEARFQIEIVIGKTYAWEVRSGGLTIGEFSFEQEAGPRRNQLRIDYEGNDIDMGMVRLQNGAFIPEYEPMQRQHDPQGPGGAQEN